MGFVRSVAGLLSQRSRIEHTGLQKVLTRFGMFQMKMYRHKAQEILAIASLDFFDLETPILCIYAGTHQCDPLEETCGCHHQTDTALETIRKTGGMLLYIGTEPHDIDGLLKSIRARRLQAQNRIDSDGNFRSYLKGLRGWALLLDFVLRDAGCRSVQLICDNPTVVHVVEQTGITIDRQSAAIAYTYGDSVPSSGQAVLEAAKAITFEYGKAR